MEHHTPPASRVGDRYSQADLELIAEARRLGFTWSDVRVLVGRDVSVMAIKQAYRWFLIREEAKREAAKRAARIKQRACLRCRATFTSEHFGHRLCSGCRSDIAALPPVLVDSHTVSLP